MLVYLVTFFPKYPYACACLSNMINLKRVKAFMRSCSEPFYLHKAAQSCAKLRLLDASSASYFTTLCYGQFKNTLQVKVPEHLLMIPLQR